jgi:gliding motility-associated-like protein
MLIADTCVNSFFKQYKSYADNEIPLAVLEINKSVYIGGHVTEMIYQQQALNTFVTKLNNDGHIVKQRILRIGDGNHGTLIKTKDSAMLLFGGVDSSYYSYPIVARIDTNLNINWVKIIPFAFASTSGGNYRINDVKQADDGSYFVLANEQTFPFDARTLLIKLDANGNFIWSKIYRFNLPAGEFNITVGRKITLDNSFAYITVSNDYNDVLQTMLLKASLTDGSVVWFKKFNAPESRIRISDYISTFNNELFFTGYGGQYPYYNIILKTDLDGNVVKANKHFVPGTTSVLIYSASQNAYGTLSAVTRYSPTGNPLYLDGFDCNVKLNTNLDVIHSKKRSVRLIKETRDIASGENNVLYETGYSYPAFYNDSYNYAPYLIKYDANGTLGVCPSDTFEFSSLPLAITTSPLTVTQKDTAFTLRIPPYYTKQHYMAENRLICSSVSGCDTLKILGQDTICNRLAVYNYTLHKNSGCNAPIQWDYNSADVQIIYSDDNTISLKFLREGDIKLKATLFSNCLPVKDSIIVHIYNSPDSLNLGPDSILCNATAVILRAGPKFKNYLWQDGSTDSLFTATAAGIYHVTVTDSCNNIYKDSVLISTDTYSPFDIGPDTTKCNQDSILLQVNTGFSNYNWTPLLNIVPISPAAVKVFPNSSMFYYVTAKKVNGCLLKDSIYITVNHSPAINLGIDRNICMGDSLQLNAGNGFANYLWSTGESTPSVYVNAAGTFYVTATDANNCISKDTMMIGRLLALPIVNLTNDTTICAGQQKTIDAGAGFSAYLWSTGSTTQSININSLGSYWVRVTDNNNCKAFDTLSINKILPSPSRFLTFRDTAVCTYDTITLKTNLPFQHYLWSNGSFSPAITVNTIGRYWLMVTSDAGCVGKDTVTLIAKACYRNIFFPTSFTPNGDSRNDNYKPTVYGFLDRYHIKIYNRWGQKVFESSDPLIGWNGNFGGLKQLAGGFVWECTYQFKNAIMETERGSFLLLR